MIRPERDHDGALIVECDDDGAAAIREHVNAQADELVLDALLWLGGALRVKPTSVKLPARLHHRLSAHSERADVPMAEILRDALEHYLDAHCG